MAIEFRCIRCGQLLRVTDSDQGQRARCPTCNAIVDIPGAEQPASPVLMSGEKSDVIDYELIGEENQYVEITLDPSEVTVADMESLLYMSSGIAMERDANGDSGGGLLEKISQVGRLIVSGSSLRMTAFCNVAEQREVVAFAPLGPSRLIPIHLNEYENQLMCRSDAILCLARGIKTHDAEVPGVSEVTSLQQISGDGIAILQSAGQLFHRQLKPKKMIAVKTNNIVAFTSEISIVPHEHAGVSDINFISEVTGPGEIWLKTSN